MLAMYREIVHDSWNSCFQNVELSQTRLFCAKQYLTRRPILERFTTVLLNVEIMKFVTLENTALAALHIFYTIVTL